MAKPPRPARDQSTPRQGSTRLGVGRAVPHATPIRPVTSTAGVGTVDGLSPHVRARLPNALSLARLTATPIVVALLLVVPAQTIPAAILLALASVTDYLDGYLARRWAVTSQFGVFCDLMADKLLVAAVLIALVGTGHVASWIAIIIVGRELVVSSLRAWAAGRNVVIPAGIWGKAKTMLTLIAIVFVILAPSFILSTVLLLAATLLTLLSALDYIAQAWTLASR